MIPAPQATRAILAPQVMRAVLLGMAVLPGAGAEDREEAGGQEVVAGREEAAND